MAKSVTENSAISFRIAMDSYKNIRGFTNKQLAEDLGCSEQTISNLHNNPLAGSS